MTSILPPFSTDPSQRNAPSNLTNLEWGQQYLFATGTNEIEDGYVFHHPYTADIYIQEQAHV